MLCYVMLRLIQSGNGLEVGWGEGMGVGYGVCVGGGGINGLQTHT